MVNRSATDPQIEVTLRIPGTWDNPGELLEQLPEGFRLTPEELELPDGTRFEFNPLPADRDFPNIFASSCPKQPTEWEREQIENYTVNFCLVGPGGSLHAARQLMVAATAILDAGAAGVFVDNSGISHGATDWKTLTEDRQQGGVYWAFVSACGSEQELYSLGMQILGYRDAVIPRTGDDEFDHRTLHSFLGYYYGSGNPIKDGELLGDAILPTFCAYREPYDRMPSDAPMFNPFGQWRLKQIPVENN